MAARGDVIFEYGICSIFRIFSQLRCFLMGRVLNTTYFGHHQVFHLKDLYDVRVFI